jgi:mono/diheme cytochrome c family protein
MNTPKKRRLWPILLGALGGLVLCLVTSTTLRNLRSFDAPYPDIQASKDPAVIERGRYLVRGPAHCGECHGKEPSGEGRRLDEPLTGGLSWELPVGTFYARNITPDPETGIGNFTDPEIARVLRYGVKPDGDQVLPFMPFANLSDEDLRAIVSYLRTMEPVREKVPDHAVNALGYFAKGWLMGPKGPTRPLQKVIEKKPTAEYGAYLARDVGNCIACHTKMDMRTGELVGAPFAGGNPEPSHADPSKVFHSPNLTPDPRWGWLAGWTEDTFRARFRAGRVHSDSPMPWEAFSRLDDDDLTALFAYLQSLPAAPGGPDPKRREVITVAQKAE